MGEKPPAFDILAWNADSTRMPAAMHSFYLRSCYLENQLAEDKMTLAGVGLHLGDIATECYVVAAVEDHIAPWQSSYATTRLLPAPIRDVLTSAGHIAGVVNPPGPKARLWTTTTWRATPTSGGPGPPSSSAHGGRTERSGSSPEPGHVAGYPLWAARSAPPWAPPRHVRPRLTATGHSSSLSR
jgi:hypothetical protein